MRNMLVTAVLALVAASSVACSGARTRTPDAWKSEVGQGFQAHVSDLKTCYDNAGLKAKVSITVRLVAAKLDESGDGSNPISVEGVDPGGAPTALVDCVKQAASSIALRPEDTNKGTGSWVVTFDPDVAPSVSPGAM